MASGQTVRLPRRDAFEIRVGTRAEVAVPGIMPSGLLWHPLFVGWP